MGQVTVISGAERRRQWSDEQKLALIEAAFAPGAKVARVAAQADIRPSQIYRWRRDLLGPQSMVPVVVTGQSSETVAEPVIVIEVQGATVRIMPDASALESGESVMIHSRTPCCVREVRDVGKNEKALPHGDRWPRNEVDETAFRDARLGRRFGELLCRLSDGMGRTIPLACQDWASTKAACRFFSDCTGPHRLDVIGNHPCSARLSLRLSRGKWC